MISKLKKFYKEKFCCNEYHCPCGGDYIQDIENEDELHDIIDHNLEIAANDYKMTFDTFCEYALEDQENFDDACSMIKIPKGYNDFFKIYLTN